VIIIKSYEIAETESVFVRRKNNYESLIKQIVNDYIKEYQLLSENAGKVFIIFQDSKEAFEKNR
jgi:hypothetical protein